MKGKGLGTLTISQCVTAYKTVGFGVDYGSQIKALDSPQNLGNGAWYRASSDNKNLASNREDIKYLCVCAHACVSICAVHLSGVFFPPTITIC